MNTAVASSKRLAVSAQDHAAIAARTGTIEHLIGFWVDDPRSQVPSLRTAYQEAGMPAAGPMVDRTAFSMFNLISRSEERRVGKAGRTRRQRAQSYYAPDDQRRSNKRT